MARRSEAHALRERNRLRRWQAERAAGYLGCWLLAVSLVGRGAALADRDWPVFSGALSGTKHSALSDINRDNVARLAFAWEWQTGEQPLIQYATAPGMFETTPLMVNGVLYLSTPYNRVVALDSTTGRELWSYDPKAYVAGQVPNGT